MDKQLPNKPAEFLTWTWQEYQPYYQDLLARVLAPDNLAGWLREWSDLSRVWHEAHERLMVATTVDTTDRQVEQRYADFLARVYPAVQEAEQQLKEKYIGSGLRAGGFEIADRNLHAEAQLFRSENLPLISEERRLATEYDRIIGDQTVALDGRELTLLQLVPLLQEQDRARREHAWRLAASRQLEDREAINTLWGKFMALRRQLAENAGYADYRAFRWRQLLRFDYSPADCEQFQLAIEQVVVPAAHKIYERRRQRLGVAKLRPWDLEVDPNGLPPLKAFQAADELEAKCAAIFQQVNPRFGSYFNTMREEGLLDLENRKGKAPGGYCSDFLVTRRPFIFANAVGTHEDVQTLLHEGGHAFHTFEYAGLPYFQQITPPAEFAEVASMGMELLAAPYLEAQHGGFYTPAEAARARIEDLERNVLFLPYMAVVDAFQHWVYTHHAAASNPANCDAAWAELWARFMLGVDWSGLEAEMETGWQRKGHIHQDPFYYVEYGLAMLGAFQVWRNSLANPAEAVESYRQALALGGSVSLPALFRTAGARFAMDAATLGTAIDLIEATIAELAPLAGV